MRLTFPFSSLSFLPRTLHAENWGGLAALIGDLVLLAGGDTQSLSAMALFLTAEIVRLRIGHRAIGYSLGYALSATGVLFITFSDAAIHNPSLHHSLVFLSLTFGVATLRWPLTVAAPHAPHLAKIATVLPLCIGAITLLQRIPILISTYNGHNLVIFIASLFWMIADILMNKLLRPRQIRNY